MQELPDLLPGMTQRARPTVESEVRVPLLQAATLGCLFAGLLEVAYVVVVALFVPVATWAALLRVVLVGLALPVGGFFAVALWKYPARRDRLEQTLIARLEVMTQRDLDHSGGIGDVHGMTVNVPPEPDWSEVMADRTDELIAVSFASHATIWSALAPALSWGQEPNAYKLCYVPIRDALIRAKIARWINPKAHNLGWLWPDDMTAASARELAAARVQWPKKGSTANG